MKFRTGLNQSKKLLAAGCMAVLALVFAGCGGGSSSPASAPNPSNPVPRITTIAPSSAPAGSRELGLSVFGANFISGSVVRLDGSSQPTTYESNTRLTATISPADLSSVGEKSVTVFNPSPGGGTSTSALFRITEVEPIEILTTILPDAHNSKEYSYSMKAQGGISPYSWSIAGGSLPNGLSLSDSGEISGTPPIVGGDTNFGFDAQVSDFSFEPETLDQSLNILVRSDGLGRNEMCSTASPISNGVISASISPLGDIDVYSFQGTEGNEVEIETYARRQLSRGTTPTTWITDVQLDTYLELLDSDCEQLEENDDIIQGDIQDSLISDYALPYTGTYYIRVSDLRGDGRPDFPYELHLSGSD